MLKESFKMSWQNIVHNKMRSFLTVLGIVIGVTAIIALITIVQGVTGEVTSQFSDLGAGKITVQAQGTPLKQGLNDTDLQKLSALDNLEGVSPTVTLHGSAARNGKVEDSLTVEGKNEVYFRRNPELVARGRALNILDVQGKSHVCVVNTALEKSLFFGEDSLGKTLSINGLTYTVVGVLSDDTTSDVTAMMSGRSGSDPQAIIPYTAAMQLAGAGSITSLELLVADSARTDSVVQNAKVILNEAFNYKDDSYTVINMDSLLDTMNSMTGMMTTMLAGIASIALLVGGIGIMNMMLVSVTERTREIGLRKALGAQPRHIQLQFLIESILLSLLGGITGILLGVGISIAVCAAIGITFRLSLGAIALGAGFSAAVGVVFGWAPARKASLLNPIDALRSE